MEHPGRLRELAGCGDEGRAERAGSDHDNPDRRRIRHCSSAHDPSFLLLQAGEQLVQRVGPVAGAGEIVCTTAPAEHVTGHLALAPLHRDPALADPPDAVLSSFEPVEVSAATQVFVLAVEHPLGVGSSSAGTEPHPIPSSNRPPDR